MPVLRLRKPSEQVLQRMLSEARTAAPTYPEVGATRNETLPIGYRHDRYEIHLGDGDGVFARAGEALRRWHAQTGAGVEIVPRNAWVDEDETVVLLLRAAGLWAPAPCRVVYVVDEPDKIGFAYGTLPGHPEMGEAAFTVVGDGKGEVVFVVTSFSRTVDPLARLGAPVARIVQKRVTRRYLTALAEASHQVSHPC